MSNKPDSPIDANKPIDSPPQTAQEDYANQLQKQVDDLHYWPDQIAQPTLPTTRPPLKNTISLQQLINDLHQWPAWPNHLHDILASLNRDDLDASDLSKHIACEQTILAKLLRVANSPFYGVAGHVSNALQAINIVGMSNTRSIVIAVAVMSKTPQEPLPWFNLPTFWKDGITVASAAQWLAEKLSLSSSDAFTAGMLHDIGQIILAYKFPKQYAEIWSEDVITGVDLAQRERALFGFDHAEVGAALAKQWNFPDMLVDSLRWHHDPDQSTSKNARVLWAADQIASLTHQENLKPDELRAAIETVLILLMLKENDWETLLETTRQKVNAFGALL